MSSGKKDFFDTLPQVEKYEMSKEDYQKKENSVYAWKKKKKLAQFAEKDQEGEQKAEENEKRQQELADVMEVGQRCEVRVTPEAEPRRGTIRFKGESEALYHTYACSTHC